MSELAIRLNVTKGAITQLARRLEVKGAIKRIPHPNDKRAALLTLTDAGIRAYRAHETIRSQFYEMLFMQLGPHHLTSFEQGVDIAISLLQNMFKAGEGDERDESNR